MKATKTWVLIVLLLIPAINVHAWPWPDTGQTKYYNKSTEISCLAPGQPFYGQDAQYQGPARSYTKLGLKNTGGGILTGNATTEAPFSIISGGSHSLGPDQSKVVTIRYQPISEGSHTGKVVFTGGDGATVPVTGKTEKPLGLPWLMLLLGSGPISSVYSGEAEVSAWQTYCGSEPGRVHRYRWAGTAGELTVKRLPPVSPTFRSGYAFTRDGDLIAQDRASYDQFRFDAEAGSFAPIAAAPCPQFITATHSFEQESGQVAACPVAGGECTIIPILEGAFTYAFAENSGRVMAATNYGEVLIFDGAGWCRTSRSGDTYRCDPNEPMLTKSTGVQFYSSIDYMDKTLVGEFPTGRLYEFDGEELRPADMLQPPFVTGETVGYEAQSMAEYCGDLFVGYYPRGEIWRLHHSTGNWSMAARLFSHPVSREPLVPYSDRPDDGVTSSFYGQRVTALVPLGDSLYAATSNLGSWPPGYVPRFLTKDEAAEYGTIYRLTIPGCETIEAARTESRAKDNLYRTNGCRQGACARQLPLIDRTRF